MSTLTCTCPRAPWGDGTICPVHGTATRYPTEAADGTPHLAYFAEGVSFVWSGNAEHPIQVCPGGYGERVVDTIWPDLGPATWTPMTVVIEAFKRACDRWLRDNPEWHS